MSSVENTPELESTPEFESTPELDSTPEPILQRMRTDVGFVPGRMYHYGKVMFYAVAGADNEQSMRQYHLGSDQDTLLERINRRRFELALERAGLRLWRTVIVFGLGIIPVAILLTVPEWKGDTIHSFHLVLGASLLFVEFFLLILLLFVRARVANLNAQLQSLEYENVLTSFDEGHQKRAANLFFKHQVELKQYYDQTLRQNKQAFVVGIICIGFGLSAIIAVATLLLVRSDAATTAKIAAGGLGILSTLLTGFVARIYLRVYESSAKALGDFHNRLVNTNNYHFANLLISTIEPDPARMDATSRLARVVAMRQAPAEKEED